MRKYHATKGYQGIRKTPKRIHVKNGILEIHAPLRQRVDYLRWYGGTFDRWLKLHSNSKPTGQDAASYVSKWHLPFQLEWKNIRKEIGTLLTVTVDEPIYKFTFIAVLTCVVNYIVYFVSPLFFLWVIGPRW